MATVERVADQRVILHGISWETYECLLADHVSSRVPRLTYDRGELEIAMPSTEHEELISTVALLVELLILEMGLSRRSLGSNTFKRKDLQRGFEPDACFYLQSLPRVRGKQRIDLNEDPPPDLVVEIDITNVSLPKMPVYAQLGVPEVWRYSDGRLRILVLEGERYQESAESSVLPGVTADALSSIIQESMNEDSSIWARRALDWARELAQQGREGAEG